MHGYGHLKKPGPTITNTTTIKSKRLVQLDFSIPVWI
jgi:hypothetical protein